MLAGDEGRIRRKGVVCTVYDPCCGSDGMLMNTKEHLTVRLRKNGDILRRPINPDAEIHLFGQEVQLIDATAFWVPMRKSLGDKRREIPLERAQDIVRILTDFRDGDVRTIASRAALEVRHDARSARNSSRRQLLRISR